MPGFNLVPGNVVVLGNLRVHQVATGEALGQTLLKATGWISQQAAET